MDHWYFSSAVEMLWCLRSVYQFTTSLLAIITRLCHLTHEIITLTYGLDNEDWLKSLPLLAHYVIISHYINPVTNWSLATKKSLLWKWIELRRRPCDTMMIPNKFVTFRYERVYYLTSKALCSSSGSLMSMLPVHMLENYAGEYIYIYIHIYIFICYIYNVHHNVTNQNTGHKNVTWYLYP